MGPTRIVLQGTLLQETKGEKFIIYNFYNKIITKETENTLNKKSSCVLLFSFTFNPRLKFESRPYY